MCIQWDYNNIITFNDITDSRNIDIHTYLNVSYEQMGVGLPMHDRTHNFLEDEKEGGFPIIYLDSARPP